MTKKVAGLVEQVDKRTTWAKHVADWQGSGRSQRAYCAEQGIALSSFQWWRRKLRRPEAKRRPAAFLPLPVAGTGAAVVEIELRSKTRLRLEGEAALRALDALVARIR